MKIFYFLLFIPFIAQATCRLESTKDQYGITGIELVEMKNGCAFPDTDREDCFQLRYLTVEGTGDLGASVFRKSIPLTSYCLNGQEQEVFSPSKKDQPKAFVECAGKAKPKSIRLEIHGGKSKQCDFPYSAKSHT